MTTIPFEEIQAENMARLLSVAVVEVAEGKTRSAREFFQEFWLKTQFRSEITS